MSFDLSRITFDPFKDYAGVVMEQGRVQLDADWNEWLAELSRRIQAGTLDIMGHASYPATTPAAFLITATTGTPNTITIGLGRMYVDGLLAENHGDFAKAVWDTALAELSGTPQPVDPLNTNPNPIEFTSQLYLPGATVPTGNGSYLAYLDVWIRPVIWLEDPNMIDKAVGVDTTGRLQVVWQVKLLPLSSSTQITCATPDSQVPYPANSAGLLTVTNLPNTPSGPCCLTDNSGYTGVENQFYRVEIHQGGQGSDTPTATTATFKWSRDNASVLSGVTAINPATNSLHLPASQLTVTSLGRDQTLGFHNGDWIEIIDDWSELWGNAGVMAQIDSIDVASRTITLTTTVSTTLQPPTTVQVSFPVDAQGNTDPLRHTRIRRWDQSGIVYDINGNKWCDVDATGGVIPVPASDTTLVLESGITVNFALSPATGNFNTADFWTFAARTADGKVEALVNAPPRGIHHHYTKLSVVTFSTPASYPDCRTPWPCGGTCGSGCCTVTVGDNVTSVGKYNSIQQAVDSLPANGGEVCILPGRYFEYVVLNSLSDVVIHGCGMQTRLASPTMAPAGQGKGSNTISTQTGMAAILTAVGCQHIQFRNFAVEAADNEAGILLDNSTASGFRKIARVQKTIDAQATAGFKYIGQPDWDATVDSLYITASTLPAVAANQVDLLNITGNRIAMKDVPSQWAAVYASGNELHIERNWIGLQDAFGATTNSLYWMPTSVYNDVPDGFNQEPAGPQANGGIHIAGPSQDVYVCDNEIDGGWRNGITLGNFIFVDPSGNDSGMITGLLPTSPPATVSTTSLNLPSTVTIGNTVETLAAGGRLQDVEITRNRIRNMGLCGIGPVGFFDFQSTIEIIGIQNLTVAGNEITGSLQDTLEPLASRTNFGYGAICLPDVENLIVRYNTITDFGPVPGAEVCGIFVFNGEQVEIRRNQVIETRDWSEEQADANIANIGAHAGLLLGYVTPPPLDPTANQSAWGSATNIFARPIYQPGLPAVTIEHNVVRVPLGLSLQLIGDGPFEISSNQFSSGGAVPASSATGERFSIFLNVVILNLGLPVEFDPITFSYSALFNSSTQATLQGAGSALAKSSSGAVHFTHNHCQLEARVSKVEGIASVAIFTFDHLNFADNHLWVDGTIVAIMDALLFGVSLQAKDNRFQEAFLSTLISGFTWGLMNITVNNISTFCLLAPGILPKWTVNSPNEIFINLLCPNLDKG